MSKLVIVGQAPGRGDGGPCEGRLGRKLAELFGCTYEEYLAGTERFNVLGRWPGKNGKGDAFPIAEARCMALALGRKLNGRSAVLLGGSVARAFDAELPWLKKATLHVEDGLWFEASVVPHPSGVNRWWNSAKNRRAAKRFLRDVWQETRVNVSPRDAMPET